jgi:hypothetical protein
MDPAELFISVLTLDYNRFMGAFSKAYLGESQLIRRAENPYAFLETRTEKILSYMHLHYRYFMLLVYPKEQCAEYAYDCIPKVTSLADDRNTLSFGLYGGFVAATLLGLLLMVAFPSRTGPCTDNTARSTTGSENGSKISAPVDPPSDGETGGTELQSDDKGVRLEDITSSSLFVNVAPGCDEPFWLVECGSLLTSLTWLSVPFLPMSGVFLKLGTLLAERLLYIPSMGWCMILALLLHAVFGMLYSFMMFIRNMFRRDDEKSVTAGDILSEFQVIPRFLLLVTLGVICWKYSTMTMEYNKIWKDPEALFVHGLKVCPRSAKLNLQVAKIHVNRGEYAKGKVFVDNAEKIDPEFCDIGYQKALIALFHDNDVEGAMALAIDNLGCPFSNVGSLELVTKLMDLQLSNSPRNHKLIASHGDLYLQGSMTSMAIQKYQTAVTVAFEAGALKEAISYSVKAEKSLSAVLAENGLQEWQKLRLRQAAIKSYDLHYNAGFSGYETATQRLGRDHACFVDMLGGGVRAHISHQLDSKEKPKSKLGKTEKTQLARKKEILFRAIQPSCIIFDAANGRLQSTHAEKALNLLSNILVSEFNEKTRGKQQEDYDLGVVEEFANFAYTASQVYILLSNVTALPSNADGGDQFVKNNKDVKFNQQEAVTEYRSKAVDMAQTVLQLWAIAGKLHFNNENFANASKFFKLGLQWGMAGDDDAGSIGAPCNLLYWCVAYYYSSLVLLCGHK